MRAICGLILAAAILAGCGQSLEKKVVGTWKLDRAQSDLGVNKAKSEIEKQMAQQVPDSVTIDLKEDKTFTLDFVMKFKGTWSLEGTKLTLKPERPGALIAFGGKDDMALDVQPDGSTITFNSASGPNPTKLVFVKSP